jgi:parvulin-like peptidyl-prolyl isomerase
MLAARGMCLETLERDARVELLIEKLREQAMATVIVDEDEKRQFYQKYVVSAHGLAAGYEQIFIRSTGADSQEQKQGALERAETVRKRAVEGEDFGTLRREHSDDPHAPLPLKLDEISDFLPGNIRSFKSPVGYHVVRKTKDEMKSSYEARSEELESFLKFLKADQRMERYEAELRSNARVVILIEE